MIKSNHNDYNCDICDKTYVNRQNLWRHMKIHRNSDNLKNSKTPPVNSASLQNNSKSLQNNCKKTLSDTLIDNIICKYCNKIFTRHDNLTRHINLRCKKKCTDILLDENNMLKQIIEKQSEELKEVKTMISNLLNKNCKVHPKTLQKINKQLNGDNNTVNETTNNNTVNETTNNNTVNNNITYNIIALGHENLTEVFSKKEKMNILKYKYGSLSQLVEYAHFNDKYPQFKNILITNTQNSIAYKHNPKNNQFVAVKKDDLLEDIVDARICDINSFYEELEGELDEKTKEIIDKLKEQIENDSAYRDLKKNDIKLIIYNNRKKVFKNNSKLKKQKEINKELKKETNKEIEV